MELNDLTLKRHYSGLTPASEVGERAGHRGNRLPLCSTAPQSLVSATEGEASGSARAQDICRQRWQPGQRSASAPVLLQTLESWVS